MKKLLILTFALLLTSTLAALQTTAATATAAAPAKEANMSVKRVVHKNAVKNDAITNGQFTWKRGGTMTMVFSETDKLLMEGTTYTLVMNGRKQVANADNSKMLGAMQNVVDNILSGGDGRVNAPSVVIDHSAGSITISPDEKLKKARLLFTSFVITFDAKKGTLKSIRMNSRGKNNYTDYLF